MTLCKLTGQPAPAGVSPDQAVQELAITPDPAAPIAACGSTPGSSGGVAPTAGSGLPGGLPSLPALPGTSLPPIVP